MAESILDCPQPWRSAQFSAPSDTRLLFDQLDSLASVLISVFGKDEVEFHVDVGCVGGVGHGN